MVWNKNPDKNPFGLFNTFSVKGKLLDAVERIVRTHTGKSKIINLPRRIHLGSQLGWILVSGADAFAESVRASEGRNKFRGFFVRLVLDFPSAVGIERVLDVVDGRIVIRKEFANLKRFGNMRRVIVERERFAFDLGILAAPVAIGFDRRVGPTFWKGYQNAFAQILNCVFLFDRDGIAGKLGCRKKLKALIDIKEGLDTCQEKNKSNQIPK